MRKTVERRTKECFDKIYGNSKSAFERNFSFDELLEYTPLKDGKKYVPYEAFYIEQDLFYKFLDDACKGLRWHWRWPRRSEIDKETGKLVVDEEWEEYYAELYKKNEQLDKKVITRKEYNAWENEMAKKYSMQKRSRDREAIRFSVLLGPSPTTNYEMFIKVKEAFPKAFELHNENKNLEDCLASYRKPVTDEDVTNVISERKSYFDKVNKDMDLDYSSDIIRTSLSEEKVRHDMEMTSDSNYKLFCIILTKMCEFWENYLKIKDNDKGC